MDTGKLKTFAQEARRQLLEQVSSKLTRILAEGSMARRESVAAVKELEQQIAGSSRDQAIERVAYTWFNRFCALRLMDVNRYTRIGTVSPTEGFHQPEILMEAKQGHIDDDWKCDNARVLGLLDGSLPSDHPQQEAYRLLLVAVCNAYHSLMPFIFERIADYTELLLPDDLLSENSVLTATRDALTVETCQDVEVIGWLYQFYISEKKENVFAALKKGKKITSENIPAATQLFTPHWIVRYLVENSLGRLWMLNHPDSRLIERMDYYIQPEEAETEFLRISSPEEIKICDPACGSGHMLTYAFDLLYAIYEEQGYQTTDIARLILENNLYGVEIDQRAGALAAFALTMKAREKYKRFLSPGKIVQPNVCVLENIHIDPEDLSAYMDKVGRDLFSAGLQGVVNQWEEADNLGSLIRPLVTDVSEVLELLRERQMGEDLFLASVHRKVLKALRQAEYLSPKYHVVVANPPYMGSNGMNAELKTFLGKHYKESKADVMTAFVDCSKQLTGCMGFLATINLDSWMFLASFNKFRQRLFEWGSISSLVHIGWNCFPDGHRYNRGVAFVVQSDVHHLTGRFFNLANVEATVNKKQLFLQQRRDGQHILTETESFESLPGQPVAYWMSASFRNAFEQGTPLGDLADFRIGMATGKNEHYVRLWHEVSVSRAGIGVLSREESKASGKKWFPYAKGGVFRRWAGNREHFVNWESDGHELQTTKHPSGTRLWAHNFNLDQIFRESICWTQVTDALSSFRYYPHGYLFDAAAGLGQPTGGTRIEFLLGLLNSKISEKAQLFLNPTRNLLPGTLASLPAFEVNNVACVGELITIAENDWNSSEVSWDFATFPLLRSTSTTNLRNKFAEVAQEWRTTTHRGQQLEEENNRLLIEAYHLEDEFSPSVPLNGITLSCNPPYRYGLDKSESELEALLLADTMREFISYAVGCMFGRYSLDKSGLILANQGETADDYRQQIPEPTFPPDEDNVIPLLDGDWFPDDISERFKGFLKVTFGTEHYEENLTFLENALYPDNLTGKKRKTIRDYFLKEFYNHHIKLYKKRPIYWLFSSPKGTFNALIYMHRYRPDTVSVVLNDYLRELHTKLTAKVDHLQAVANSASASTTEKAKALKEITKLKKDLKELEDYEHNVLYPLATRQIEIDLDDGVKVNYNKFGKALRKVPGLSK